MPLFGAHMSISGGYHKAIEAAEEFGCETFQMFNKNASQWKGKVLVDEEVELFKDKLSTTKLKHPTAHDSYLINLASPDQALYQKSIDAFCEEIRRSDRFGLQYLVAHPGAHVESGEEAGLERIVSALDEVCETLGEFQVMVLLETTAGQGTTLGHRFEHLGYILKNVKSPDKFGVCLDTCHVFAAGYDISQRSGYKTTFEEFDRTIGLKQLRLFHLNDSKKPLGSRVDRHEHLGQGCIGKTAFELLVQDPRFAKHPMILETPKSEGERKDMDRDNLKFLRQLVS
ncbi:deoxyribonuclease IV [Telmatocola sphagniphila]|uniref:Probable endonuclease 4 n=1 Tax=Telmatocola sphagniphila TaxID=1123043 RepID=A0A8E6EUY6_9BACT|nr:deoxyribonuclease IV [Telmatocola sphagniphila]QVL32020.1 deoxyribonuclease IV [Telmatocola sphagniphila]